MKFRPGRNGGYYARKDHAVYCVTPDGKSAGNAPYSVRVEFSPCNFFRDAIDMRGVYQFETAETAMAFCERIAGGALSMAEIRQTVAAARTCQRQAGREQAAAEAEKLLAGINVAGISLDTFRTLIRAYHELPKGVWEIISGQE